MPACKACWFVALAAVFTTAATAVIHGEYPPEESAPARPAKAKPSLPTPTPEREAAARMFVQMNHPELAALLDQLKTDKPAAYDKAIRELFKTFDQLNRTMDQDPQKYALDLDAWKVKSRIQLLIARAGLSDGNSLELPLREAVRRQQEIRVEQLAWQRDQVAQRLKKLDEQLSQARNESEAQAEKQFTSLLRGIKKAQAASARKRPSGQPSPAPQPITTENP